MQEPNLSDNGEIPCEPYNVRFSISLTDALYCNFELKYIKKLLPIVMALLILLTACGNSAKTSSPTHVVKNGAFTCSAQELIDNINELTRDSKEFAQISTLPDKTLKPDLTTSSENSNEPQFDVWDEKAENNEFTYDIEIDGPDLTMTLREKDGKLYSVEVNWIAENSNSVIATESETLTSALFTLLVPNPDLAQKNRSKVKGYGFGSGSSWDGGVDVYYSTSDESGKNLLCIDVHEDPGQP